MKNSTTWLLIVHRSGGKDISFPRKNKETRNGLPNKSLTSRSSPKLTPPSHALCTHSNWPATNKTYPSLSHNNRTTLSTAACTPSQTAMIPRSWRRHPWKTPQKKMPTPHSFLSCRNRTKLSTLIFIYLCSLNTLSPHFSHRSQ